jgi:GNAT superfamily N-acetyltransferase
MIELRPARADEAGTLLAIQRAASIAAVAHVFSPDRYPFPDDVVREQWRAALADPAVEVLVAERGGEAVGLVSFAPEWLRSLHVLPTAQRAGVGSLLHDEALARRRTGGDAVCRLWTLEENHDARRFYERRGWRLDGRTRTISFPPHPPEVGYSIEL